MTEERESQMGKSVVIREATLADHAGLLEVFRDELAHHIDLLPDRFRMPETLMPPGWLEEQLALDNTRLFVANLDGKVTGLVLVRIDSNRDVAIDVPRQYVYISELGVLAGYRGMGIGGALMHYVEAWALDMGITTIELNVWETNTGALRFYDRLGYETLSRRMVKRL